MEEQSHHCGTRSMRQKRPPRDSKSCTGDDSYNGGIQSQSSQTAHSAMYLTHGEGDDSCNGVIQSQLSHTAHSALHLSLGEGDENFDDRIWRWLT
eukprot:15361989-Ditylum_brightwellii.AAC.1